MLAGYAEARNRVFHNRTTSPEAFRMDSAIVTGLTGIFGSLLGGSASVVTAWVTQKTLNKRKEFRAELTRREMLYGQFITNAQHARWIRLSTLWIRAKGCCQSTLCLTASGFVRRTQF